MNTKAEFTTSFPSSSSRVKNHPPQIRRHDRPSSNSKKGSLGSKDEEVPATLSLKGQLLQLLAIAAVAWFVATSGFRTVEWIKQQLKPFCDSTSVAETSDDCIPCPRNGVCRGGSLECFLGFKKVGKSCVEDKEIDQTAEKLADYLQDHACRLSAIAACDGLSGELWLTEAESRARLTEGGVLEQLGLDQKSWLLVWEKTLDLARNSIIVKSDAYGQRELSCPRELVQRYKTVKCQIREWIAANFVTLLLASPMVLLLALFIRKYLKHKKILARAEVVYNQVCEALEEKALESKEIPGGESWVVVSRLRDHILLRSERKSATLWKQVERLVQEDSRIDQYQMKVKGEMKIVWEWQVEGALRTPSSRKKVRPQPNCSNVPTQLQPQGTRSSKQPEFAGRHQYEDL